MSDQEKRKNSQVEWSFSFADLGQRLDEFVRSLGVSGEEAIKTEHFREGVGAAARANVRLDSPVGETTVRAAADDALIEATVTHVGEVTFVASGETEKQVTLSQQTHPASWMRGIFGWIGSTGRLRWDIALTPSIPLDVDIHSGLGKAIYDFGPLNLSSLDIHGGTGEIVVTLPRRPDMLRAAVNGGVGEIEINIPPNTNVDLEARAGTGEIEITFGEGAAVTAAIKGGVGECELKLPAGAEARIEASMGLGEVQVPPRFARMSGEKSFVGGRGVWQTAGYETAERKISIKFDGGLGALVVR